MNSQIYTCPMHPEIKSSEPGKCPICGMNLVLETDSQEKSKFELYRPLLIIIGLIILPVLAISIKQGFELNEAMYNFMAGFFLVFGGFKLLDLTGFAQAYYSYDLLARRWFNYGYIYPFIEIALGLAYLTRFELDLVNYLTLLVMGFSGLGVLQSLLQKRKFQCACLGTVIKVPLTNVTLVEDFGMAAMALLSILI